MYSYGHTSGRVDSEINPSLHWPFLEHAIGSEIGSAQTRTQQQTP